MWIAVAALLCLAVSDVTLARNNQFRPSISRNESFKRFYPHIIKRANFTVNDLNVSVPNPITTDLKVGNSYHYPCYISVVTYATPEMKTVIKGATVTVLTKERSTKDYIGYTTTTTDQTGHACVLSLCRKEAIIFVEYRNERLFALKNQSEIPFGFTHSFQTRNEEIRLSVRSWGTVYGKTGPVYILGQEKNCLTSGKDNWHFDFSLLSVQSGLTSTAVPLSSEFDKMAWNFAPLNDRACFIKVKVKVQSYQTSVVLDSMTADNRTYGVYTDGPKENPESGLPDVKAACLEFRCPLSEKTALSGKLIVPSKPNGCSFKKNTYLGTTMEANETTFSLPVTVSSRYGPKYGIYIAKGQDVAKRLCFTGRNELGQDYNMNPDTNYAIFYDCMQPQPSAIG